MTTSTTLTVASPGIPRVRSPTRSGPRCRRARAFTSWTTRPRPARPTATSGRAPIAPTTISATGTRSGRGSSSAFRAWAPRTSRSRRASSRSWTARASAWAPRTRGSSGSTSASATPSSRYAITEHRLRGSTARRTGSAARRSSWPRTRRGPRARSPGSAGELHLDLVPAAVRDQVERVRRQREAVALDESRKRRDARRNAGVGAGRTGVLLCRRGAELGVGGDPGQLRAVVAVGRRRTLRRCGAQLGVGGVQVDEVRRVDPPGERIRGGRYALDVGVHDQDRLLPDERLIARRGDPPAHRRPGSVAVDQHAVEVGRDRDVGRHRVAGVGVADVNGRGERHLTVDRVVVALDDGVEQHGARGTLDPEREVAAGFRTAGVRRRGGGQESERAHHETEGVPHCDLLIPVVSTTVGKLWWV